MFYNLCSLISILVFYTGALTAAAPVPSTSPTAVEKQKAGSPPPPGSGPTGKPFGLHPRPNLMMNVRNIFSSPGIVTLQGSEWVGTEHLFNLPEALGVVVEIIKPAALNNVPVTEEKVKEQIAAILKSARLSSREPIIEKQTPLPFIHALIIIHPIDKGYVVYCAVRLFEEVQVSRIFLKPGIIWQAITWEKQEMLVTPADQLSEQLNQTLQGIMAAFTDRIKDYALDKSLHPPSSK